MPDEIDEEARDTASSAKESRVYASKGEILDHYALDPTAPALVWRSSVTLPAPIQSGCRHATLDCLYIASSKGSYLTWENPVQEHYLTAFRIEPSGELTQMSETITLPYRPVSIALDRAGTSLLIAYSVPATTVTIFAILDDGSIGEATEYPTLDMRHYPHQITTSPGDDFAAVSCTGQILDTSIDPATFRGAIHVYAYDNGTLGEEIQTVAPNDGLGFGPRHVAFHPSLPFAYVTFERQNLLRVYRYDSTGFEPEALFTSTTLFGGASKGMQVAGVVHLHPSGRFAYVGNRTPGRYEEDGRMVRTEGGDDIAVFEIDLKTGEPTPIQRIDAEGIMPRSITTDPSGELLIVGNQYEIEAYKGDVLEIVPQSLVIYRIGADGQLELAWKHQLEMGDGAMVWMNLFTAA